MSQLDQVDSGFGGASRPLTGIRIVDLSRILAGPTATQLLGDFGADVIKVEHPIRGDDTRGWGPPFVQSNENTDSDLSAYFIAANRNKRSIGLDISTESGQSLLRRLVEKSDIVVENYKVGALARYGLSYDDLKTEFPRLIYCSITGFGQTGPYAERMGYDLLVQAAGGIMSITGETDGAPMKVPVGISDLMCGMYASSAILAALRHRDLSGQGQYIDLSLFDCQVAWLINAATNFLVSGIEPRRWGNAHPNIVPYRVYEVADGYFVLAVGNDEQFRNWCDLVGAPYLADTFPTNAERVINRETLERKIETLMKRLTRAEWDRELAKRGIPGGPVNTIGEVFGHPQIRDRGCKVEMSSSAHRNVIPVIANPIRFSETPVSYDRPPPSLGEHTDEILEELLEIREVDRRLLRSQGVVR